MMELETTRRKKITKSSMTTSSWSRETIVIFMIGMMLLVIYSIGKSGVIRLIFAIIVVSSIVFREKILVTIYSIKHRIGVLAFNYSMNAAQGMAIHAIIGITKKDEKSAYRKILSLVWAILSFIIVKIVRLIALLYNLISKITKKYAIIKKVIRENDVELIIRKESLLHTDITYDSRDGNSYTIRMPKTHTKGRIFSSISEQDSKTVTSNVLKFMGPMKNFHGIYTTPRNLGYDYLTFYSGSGKSLSFKRHEEIRFPDVFFL